MIDTRYEKKLNSSERTDCLVTVGMPVYNQERFIKEAIESVVNQSYRNLEIIISDDCSTDTTAAICKALADNDARIKFVRQSENIGHEENFKFVLKHAKGDFFMWFAGDDSCHPSLILELLNLLKRDNSIVCAAADVKNISDNGEYLGETKLKSIRASCPPSDWRSQMRIFFSSRPAGSHFCLYGLFRTHAISSVEWNYKGLVKYASAHEGPLLAQLTYLGRIASLPAALKYYRRHSDSLYSAELKKLKFVRKLRNKLNVAAVTVAVIHDKETSLIRIADLYLVVTISTIDWLLRFTFHSLRRFLGI